MAMHTRDDLARFLDGETRLVHARYRDDPEQRFYLQDGRGGEPGLREWVRGHLECPMPMCDDRRLSLVHRSGSVKPKRDGFAHHRGAGDHAPESIWHETAKEVIRRWIEATWEGMATVETEARLGDGERVADILVTWISNRVAFEIQYSPITAAQWRARHEWYVARGIRDIWLWGHAGAHVRRVQHAVGETPATFRFGEVQRAVVEAGERCIYWLNPMTEQIATAYVRRTLERRPGQSWNTLVTPDDELVSLEVEQLADTPRPRPSNGLLTNAWRSLGLPNSMYEIEQAKVERELADEQENAAAAKAEAELRRQDVLRERMQRASEQYEQKLANNQSDAERVASGGEGGAPWRYSRGKAQPGDVHCRNPRCGYRLDPVLYARGFHFGCEPAGWDRRNSSQPVEPDPDTTLF